MRILIAALTAGLLGCASIVSNSSYPVTFTSNPNGAHIVVTNSGGLRVYEGETPMTLTLTARKGFFQGEDYTIEATMDGHTTGHATLTSGLDGWYVGNILLGGLIGGLIVDPATGAMWRLDEQVVVTLGSDGARRAGGESALRVVTLDQIPQGLHRHLVRVN